MVVGLFGLTMVPVPLTKVQVPVAGAVGVLPVNVTVPVPQICWSAPALAAGEDGLKMRIRTSSVVMAPGQGPLLMVQRKMLSPMERP